MREDLKRGMLAVLEPHRRRVAYYREQEARGDTFISVPHRAEFDAGDLHYLLSAEPTASVEATEREEVDRDAWVAMPRHLTAEAGFKAALIGEFWEEIDVPNPDYDEDDFDSDEGEYRHVRVPIQWTTIKTIYDAAVRHAAALRYQSTPSSSDPASDAQVSDGTVSGWQPLSLDARAYRSVLIVASGVVGEAYYDADNDGWWWAQTDWSDYHWDRISPDPTHWMPLPALPAAPSEKEPDTASSHREED